MSALPRPRRPPRRDWTPTPPSGWNWFDSMKGPRSQVPAKERAAASKMRQVAYRRGKGENDGP